MAREVTEALADFAAGLSYDAIPERVREFCKTILLDTLACAVAGDRGEETDQVAALASALAQSKESSVIGGDRLSLAGATLLNGYLVTAVTMCDVHRSTLTHITPEGATLNDRTNLAAREEADLLVSVHHNALPDGVNPFRNNGSSTYYYQPQSLPPSSLPALPPALAGTCPPSVDPDASPDSRFETPFRPPIVA